MDAGDVSLHSSSESSSAAHETDLSAWRKALINDAGPKVPQLSLDVFCAYLLPSLAPPLEDKFEDIIKKLTNVQQGRSRSTPAYATGKRAWTSWPAPGKRHKKPEQTTFAALVKIYEAIIGAVEATEGGEDLVRLLDFTNAPDKAPESGFPSVKTRPDGYFILRSPARPNKPHWMDLVATGEYKVKDGERQLTDDIAKALWNMHHTLRDDVRRRFVYAFTIEDRRMRIWYANRAEVYVSEAFNVDSDMRLLVRFFLSFLYADSVSLGWDPTISIYKPVDGSQTTGLQYVIEVQDVNTQKKTYYRTHRVVSDFATTRLRGRGTRVWDVILCDSEGTATTHPETHMILKDCWISSRRPREGAIHGLILDDAAKQGKREEIKRIMLTVRAHGDVYVDPNTKDETPSRDPLRLLEASYFPLEVVSDKTLLMQERQRQSLDAELRGSHMSPHDIHERTPSVVAYEPKTHYRIVFTEACTALREEKYLDRAIVVVKKACEALKALHGIGWLHRDISIGNILTRPDGTVVLSDFEYAKRFNDQSVHDIRTGTPAFMAVEVKLREYIFGSKMSTSRMLRGLPSEARQQQLMRMQNSNPNSTSSFAIRHNPIHDVESLLWIMAYCTVNKDMAVIPNPDLDPADSPQIVKEMLASDSNRNARLDKQFAYARKLFVEDDTPSRRLFLKDEAQLIEIGECLHPTMTICGAPVALESIRAKLVEVYTAAEKDVSSISQDCAAPLYDELIQALAEMEADLVRAGPYRVQMLPLGEQHLLSRRPSLSAASSTQGGDDRAFASQPEPASPKPKRSQRKTSKPRSTFLTVPRSLRDRHSGVKSAGSTPRNTSPNPSTHGGPDRNHRVFLQGSSRSGLRRSTRTSTQPVRFPEPEHPVSASLPKRRTSAAEIAPVPMDVDEESGAGLSEKAKGKRRAKPGNT